MASGTTTVGVVRYDAVIDLAQLKKSLAEADKLVKKSYENQAKAAKKAAKQRTTPTGTTSGTTAEAAAARVEAIKREAQETAKTLSTYTPQLQKQFLTVERANNQVANASARATSAIQKYGEGSVQATRATSALNVAVQNQAQQQAKLQAMLNGTYKSQNSFNQGINESIKAVSGVVAGILTLQTTVSVLKNSVTAANEYQSSLVGLSRLAQRFGYDSQAATQAAQDLASDGLITVATAADGLQKLLTAGVGLPDAIKLMQGYKDQAAFGRASTIDFDTAVRNLAESFYTENSAIGNLSGQTENWNQILEYGASVLGKSVSQLSEKERVQAKLIGQQRLNNLVEGDAAVYAQTHAGAQAELNAKLKEIHVTIGQVTNALSGGLIRSLASLDKQTQNNIISWGAGVATFGAFVLLAPRVLAGVRAIIKAMKSLTIASALSSGGITVLLGALAGIGAAVAIDNLIDGLEDASENAESLASKVKAAEGGLNGAAVGAAKTAKQLAKINEEMEDARENYRYSLAQLVAEKNENIAQLTKTLEEEQKAYENAYNERLATFEKTEHEQLLEHQKKVRALQNQIDFLSKYNTTANKKQLEELKFALAQENAEYQKSTELRKAEFDAQTKSEKEEYEKRRAENQKKLNEELALLNKHREEVLSVRNVMLLDEIEMLQKQRDEQLKSLQEQRNDIINQLGDIGRLAGSALGGAFSYSLLESIKIGIDEASRYFKDAFNYKPGFYKQTYVAPDGTRSTLYVPGFSGGGYTGRGNKNDVAGIVHAGEYVLPKEVVNQSTQQPDWEKLGIGRNNITVNVSLSGVMTSSKSDERAIATRIAKLINEVVKSKTGTVAIAGV